MHVSSVSLLFQYDVSAVSAVSADGTTKEVPVEDILGCKIGRRRRMAPTTPCDSSASTHSAWISV